MSGAGAAFVRTLEARYGISLPADFAAYLTTRVPQAEYMDDAGFAWWAPDRIKSFAEEMAEIGMDEGCSNAAIQSEADRTLVFADFLVWCYAYAICCSDGPDRGKVALVGTEKDGFVAESFDQFVRLVEARSRSLHPPAWLRRLESPARAGVFRRTLAKLLGR